MDTSSCGLVTIYHLNSGFCDCGNDILLCAVSLLLYAERLGNRWSRYVSVKNGGLEAAAVECDGEHRGHKGFSDAPLSADNSNHLSDAAQVIELFDKILF